MKSGVPMVPVLFLLICLAGCERVEQAKDTLNKAKELKSDFQKKSDEVHKDAADKAEGYRDRIEKKLGLKPGAEGNNRGDSDRQDER